MINKVLINKDKRLSALCGLPQPVNELFYIGDKLDNLLKQPRIAIVGSRKVTPYGRQVTHRIAMDLARAGIVIISGLALGVDSIAHQSALEVHGKTIAVLPTGLEKIYPASHRGLAQKIVQLGGTLISEYPPTNTQPMKYQFIARNRIIAALSDGVLITEAANKSGSLHTAEFALEQGKDVFAVPGNITSATSEGTNNLIKSGAIPVTSARDILLALGVTEELLSSRPTNRNQGVIYSLMQENISDPDILMHMSGLSNTEFSTAMTELEINGFAHQNTMGHWVLMH